MPDLGGYELGKAGEVYTCGDTSIAFDQTGAVASLVRDGYTWADANHTLLSVKCAYSE